MTDPPNSSQQHKIPSQSKLQTQNTYIAIADIVPSQDEDARGAITLLKGTYCFGDGERRQDGMFDVSEVDYEINTGYVSMDNLRLLQPCLVQSQGTVQLVQSEFGELPESQFSVHNGMSGFVFGPVSPQTGLIHFTSSTSDVPGQIRGHYITTVLGSNASRGPRPVLKHPQTTPRNSSYQQDVFRQPATFGQGGLRACVVVETTSPNDGIRPADALHAVAGQYGFIVGEITPQATIQFVRQEGGPPKTVLARKLTCCIPSKVIKDVYTDDYKNLGTQCVPASREEYGFVVGSSIPGRPGIVNWVFNANEVPRHIPTDAIATLFPAILTKDTAAGRTGSYGFIVGEANNQNRFNFVPGWGSKPVFSVDNDAVEALTLCVVKADYSTKDLAKSIPAKKGDYGFFFDDHQYKHHDYYGFVLRVGDAPGVIPKKLVNAVNRVPRIRSHSKSQGTASRPADRGRGEQEQRNDANKKIFACKAKASFSKADVVKATQNRKKVKNYQPFWDKDYPFLVMYKNQDGWFVDQEKDGFVEVFIIDNTENGPVTRSKSGWVPRACLEIGREKAKNGPELRNMVPSFGIPRSLNIDTNDTDKFIIFLDTLCMNFKVQEIQMLDNSCLQTDINVISQGKTFRNWLCAGMQKCGSYQLFRHGQPTHEALWTLPHVPKDNTVAMSKEEELTGTLPGIYCILYRIKTTDGRWQYERWWYVGKSLNIRHRVNQHHVNIVSSAKIRSSITHYEVARRVHQHERGEFCAVRLAQFNVGEPGLAQKMKCAEQIFVCALHSLNPRILHGPTSSGPAAVQDFAFMDKSFVLARVISGITKSVALQVGWVLDVEISGLNWSMPMLEFQREKSRWLCVTMVDSDNQPMMKSFHKQGFKYTLDEQLSTTNINLMKNHSTWGPERVIVRIPREIGIPKGSTIYLVVEIMMDKAHHSPLSIFPHDGPFSDFYLLQRLAVRVVWVDEAGCVQTTYLQQKPNQQLISSLRGEVSQFKGQPEFKYLLSVYCSVITMIEAFLKVQYTSDPPPWKPSTIQNLFIQDVVYNHLDQSIQLEAPKATLMDVPVMLSANQNAVRMWKYYGENLGLTEAAKERELRVAEVPTDGSLQIRPSGRQACDLCFSKPGASHCGGKLQANGLFSCKPCEKLRRPCTFTQSVEDNGWEDLVWGKPRAVKYIPLPGIELITEAEDDDEEQSPEDLSIETGEDDDAM